MSGKDLVRYEGFPNGIMDSFVEHAAKTPSQYDATCRALAGEVVRLRAELQRAAVEYEARGLERAAEGVDNLVADRSIVEGSDVYAVLTQVAGSIRAMKEQQ